MFNVPREIFLPVTEIFRLDFPFGSRVSTSFLMRCSIWSCTVLRHSFGFFVNHVKSNVWSESILIIEVGEKKAMIARPRLLRDFKEKPMKLTQLMNWLLVNKFRCCEKTPYICPCFGMVLQQIHNSIFGSQHLISYSAFNNSCQECEVLPWDFSAHGERSEIVAISWRRFRLTQIYRHFHQVPTPPGYCKCCYIRFQKLKVIVLDSCCQFNSCLGRVTYSWNVPLHTLSWCH